MKKSILVSAAILGMVAIGIGAFAAHGLKESISAENLETFETGVKYQMYHALMLLFIGYTNEIGPKTKRIIFYLAIIGILFFSGSIYGLATNSLSEFDFRSIGFITPIGGLLLLSSWGLMLISFLKLPKA